MAVPLILGGIAAVAAATGIGKGIHAGMQNSEAKDINRLANETHEVAKKELEESREKAIFSLQGLGEAKAKVLDESVNPFIGMFEQMHNIELEDSVGLNEIDNFRLDKHSFAEIKEISSFAASLLGGAVTGSLAGGLAAFGAYSAAMAFGAASTGTAIASLSGIAATNATLAFLGGGALAAGGLGIAGGTMVLGGVVAGPALAVMGFMLDAKASQNLNNAHSNLAESQKIAEEFKAAKDVCEGITNRSEMFFDLLVRLNQILHPLNDKMEMIIDISGTDYSQYNEKSKTVVAMALATVAAIKKVLDTPILTENGSLASESLPVAEEIDAFCTEAQSK